MKENSIQINQETKTASKEKTPTGMGKIMRNVLLSFLAFLIALTILVFLDHNQHTFITQTESFLVNSGFVNFVQTYIMPGWKKQEQQLIEYNYPNLIPIFRLEITFSLLYALSILIYMFILNRKKIIHWAMQESPWFQREKWSWKNYIKYLPSYFFGMILCFLMFYIPMFNLPRGRYGYEPSYLGIYQQGFFITFFLLIIILTFFMLVLRIYIDFYGERK